MSLQVNLSSPDITKAYQDVVNARGMDWLILTYEKASNDLRVQSTGNGLEDLEEEFSDGRHALLYLLFSLGTILIFSLQDSIRICPRDGPKCGCRSDTSGQFRANPSSDQSNLPKFVQINWCGDGVPEAKKGLFHTHSSAVARFFRGTHVVISARNEVRHRFHFFYRRNLRWPYPQKV